MFVEAQIEILCLLRIVGKALVPRLEDLLSSSEPRTDAAQNAVLRRTSQSRSSGSLWFLWVTLAPLCILPAASHPDPRRATSLVLALQADHNLGLQRPLTVPSCCVVGVA